MALHRRCLDPGAAAASLATLRRPSRPTVDSGPARAGPVPARRGPARRRPAGPVARGHPEPARPGRRQPRGGDRHPRRPGGPSGRALRLGLQRRRRGRPQVPVEHGAGRPAAARRGRAHLDAGPPRLGGHGLLHQPVPRRPARRQRVDLHHLLARPRRRPAHRAPAGPERAAELQPPLRLHGERLRRRDRGGARGRAGGRRTARQLAHAHAHVHPLARAPLPADLRARDARAHVDLHVLRHRPDRALDGGVLLHERVPGLEQPRGGRRRHALDGRRLAAPGGRVRQPRGPLRRDPPEPQERPLLLDRGPRRGSIRRAGCGR